ncbi:MAG: thioredoxin family protein [bacterium]
MEKLTYNEYKNRMKKKELDKPMIIDFYADWCMPCKMYTPVLEEINKEREDIEIVKVNVEEEREFASDMGALSIPMTLFINKNKSINRITGAYPKPRVNEFIKAYF